jgi:hypothetical protein
VLAVIIAFVLFQIWNIIAGIVAGVVVFGVFAIALLAGGLDGDDDDDDQEGEDEDDEHERDD